jgi:predicted RNase H-like HicB family nuclease
LTKLATGLKLTGSALETIMHAYLAFIHPPEQGSSWGVTFPDLPGCTSTGGSFEDAVAQAHDSLSGHLLALRADGDPMPEPRRYEQLLKDEAEEARTAVVQLIYPRELAATRGG